MMFDRPRLLERGFQLARAGTCHSVTEIKARLKAEGFSTSEIEMHLSGKLIQKQLKQQILDHAPARVPTPEMQQD